jgi:methylglutaconyl-CoA hydratase
MGSILYQLHETDVATITLDRPDTHNAFNEELISELTDAFRDVSSNTHIRAVVLQGNGPSFCAGADLEWMRRMAHYDEKHNIADAKALSDMLQAIDICPKPVIAAVHGPAYGGGVGLIACADIAICVSSATFMLSEVKLGLTPATISPFVMRAIGVRAARRYMLTAEKFDASTARALQLVHEVVPDEIALHQRVEAFVQSLRLGAPSAVSAAKDLIRTFGGKEIDDGLRLETAKHIAQRRASPEGKEGIDAFLQKRKPDWVHD